VQPGQSVLINGASGSVGVYAIQLAKYYGAKVTAVCSAKNSEKIRILGADTIIDYHSVNFTTNGQQYDVIFDTIGNLRYTDCKQSLKRSGMFLETVLSFSILTSMLRTAFLSSKKAKFSATGLCQSQDNLMFMKKLVDAGNIVPEIDRRYSLDQIVEAHRYVEAGHKVGSVVVVVNQD